MSQRPSTNKQVAAGASARATRRPRGEPRRLLLDAARDLFARQDYRSTTTREIAEAAGVIEPLLFRHFGSKAALFRETKVVPLRMSRPVWNFGDGHRLVGYAATSFFVA